MKTPEYYGGENNQYEVVRVINAWKLSFELGNTLKYVARAGKKDPAKHLEDLQKAKNCIDLEMRRIRELKAEEAVVTTPVVEEDVREAFDWTPPKFNSLQEELESLGDKHLESKIFGSYNHLRDAIGSLGFDASALSLYAMRNDLTINELLYQINSRKIQVDELVGN